MFLVPTHGSSASPSKENQVLSVILFSSFFFLWRKFVKPNKRNLPWRPRFTNQSLEIRPTSTVTVTKKALRTHSTQRESESCLFMDERSCPWYQWWGTWRRFLALSPVLWDSQWSWEQHLVWGLSWYRSDPLLVPICPPPLLVTVLTWNPVWAESSSALNQL